MKILTLNTHSWLEENPLKKLEQIADFIMTEKVEMIALQEVNQKMSAEIAELDSYYCKLTSETQVKNDNYALLLVNYLKEHGVNFYWSWACSHIGYDIYDEGSAILSKYPFSAEEILVSKTNDVTDYHTRKILLAHLEKQDVTVASCHFSWWSENGLEGFAYEWQNLLKRVPQMKSQVLLLGDFNAPAHLENEAYDLVKKDFFDVFDLAKTKKGSYTVAEEIDGWQENTEKLRIDFGFVLNEVPVDSYEVVFDGKKQPVVSDHFGILVVAENL